MHFCFCRNNELSIFGTEYQTEQTGLQKFWPYVPYTDYKKTTRAQLSLEKADRRQYYIVLAGPRYI